jgi:methionyl-tRNA synthetase
MPEEVLAHFGGNPDPLRFYLSHEIPVGNDGDFSWKRIDEIYNAKLRNQLGNLLNRVLVLLHKDGGIVEVPAQVPERSAVEALWNGFSHHMDAFELSDALQGVTQLVDVMNARMNDVQPWKLAGAARTHSLSTLAEELRHITLMLLPFIPSTAQRMAKQLNLPFAENMLEKNFVIMKEMKEWGGQNNWTKVGEPQILFAPLAK